MIFVSVEVLMDYTESVDFCDLWLSLEMYMYWP